MVDRKNEISEPVIAIVDDFEEILDTTKLVLLVEGFNEASIHTFSSGQKCIEAFIEKKIDPDIIIMDHFMPIIDGIEASRRLRKYGYNGKIIGVSGKIDTDKKEECVDIMLDKPIDINKLIKTFLLLGIKIPDSSVSDNKPTE